METARNKTQDLSECAKKNNYDAAQSAAKLVNLSDLESYVRLAAMKSNKMKNSRRRPSSTFN